MSHPSKLALAAAIGLACATIGPRALAAGQATAGSTSQATQDRKPSSMQQLQAASDRLREAIRKLAAQPAGSQRDQAIREAHQALWQTQSAMDAAVGPAPRGSAQSNGASGQGDASGEQPVNRTAGSSTSPPLATGPVLVLLPPSHAGQSKLADGCWVRFFDDKGFRGDSLTLAGPVSLPRMEMGNTWRDWDSAIVGPKATVRTYDNENYHDRTAVLAAGRSIPDLRASALGWFEEVKSATVTCSS